MKRVVDEARLLLIGIPVAIWTLLPIYHLFLFSISSKNEAFAGKLWPDHPTLRNFDVVFHQRHYFLNHFWQQFANSLVIALAVGAITLGIRYLRLDQVDLAMATIVVAMPFVLPLMYFMMKRLSR